MNETRPRVLEAIALQKAIEAQYNGAHVKLAPHLLFERRGDLFVSALNLSKRWRSEDERQLGQFKLAGLVAAELLDEGFDPLPSFVATVPRSDDILVIAI